MILNQGLITETIINSNNLQSQIIKILDAVRTADKSNHVNKNYMGKPIVAVDLDQTMIYSQNSMGTDDTDDHLFHVTEMYQQKPLTFMTSVAYNHLEILNTYAYLVPVTTRTHDQFSRVKIPGTTKWDLESKQTQYAINTNGAVILIDGEPSKKWEKHIRKQFESVVSSEEIATELTQYANAPWHISTRNASDYYHYMIIDVMTIPQETLTYLGATMRGYGWDISLQGRKLYFIPHFISKGNALAEVARLSQADYVMAAGDSILDRSMLEMADLSFRPNHGELEGIGYMIPNMQKTLRNGIYAGEELTSMFLAQLFNKQ